MATAVAINNQNQPIIKKNEAIKKKNQSGFLTGVQVLKQNNKDFLKIITFSFQWLSSIFESLKDCPPIKNLITFTKGGESALSFNEFSQSLLKIGHVFTTGVSFSIDSITNLTRRTLELIWNFFKICKTLQNYKIINFATRLYVNLKAIGGIAFTISSADRTYSVYKELLDLENKDTEKKDEKILYYLFLMAKNIGSFAIGAIVTSSALFGTVTSNMLMLAIGTTILASNIVSTIINETYHLQLK